MKEFERGCKVRFTADHKDVNGRIRGQKGTIGIFLGGYTKRDKCSVQTSKHYPLNDIPYSILEKLED
ncbi:MAG: hypothetical protein JW786_03950 [Desulfobacterales bacterium]|nr:hypothetical protein [Desulfobacterales bacterium]